MRDTTGDSSARSSTIRSRAGFGEISLAALFFLAATVLFTWPIAPRAADGLADVWDAKFTAWVLHWDYHQTLHDPLHLYDANIFYPSRFALAFSENLYGVALFAFPMFAAGISTLAAYNVMFLLGMLLSALAAWALARDVTGDPLASVIAGLVYAFCPWRISQIPHIQFQWGAFLALSLLFLLRYLDDGRRRDLILFGACFAWNALCNVHYAVFSGFLVGLVLAYQGLVSGWRTFRPRFVGAVAAAAVVALLLFPFFLPYILASELYEMERGYGEIEFFSGVWRDFVSAGSSNKLYGPLTQKWERPEGDFFPGLSVAALALLAIGMRRREERRTALRQAPPARRRVARILDVAISLLIAVGIAAILGHGTIGPIHARDPGRFAVLLTTALFLRLTVAFPRWSRFQDLGDLLRRLRMGTRVGLFLAIAILGIVIALGAHTPYYRFLVQSMGPLFRALRAPSRGIVLFDLGLGVLAAWGLSEIVARRRPLARFALTAATVLLVGFEYRAFPVNVHPVDPNAPPVDRWLEHAEMPGPVLELPLATGDEVEFQFRSTAHWKPLLNGYSGFFPATYIELAAMFDKKVMVEKRSISPELWQVLERRGCRLLILHPHMVEDEPVRHAYLATLREALNQGRLRPMGSFVHGSATDLAFEVRGDGHEIRPGQADADASRESRRDLELMTKALNPPFGSIDSPTENEIVTPHASGFGWALDDSGVESVLVSFDSGPGTPARYGLPHPGPQRVYPNYPDAKSAGFVFAIPNLPSGSHVLTVTIVARDRGQERLMRHFRLP